MSTSSSLASRSLRMMWMSALLGAAFLFAACEREDGGSPAAPAPDPPAIITDMAEVLVPPDFAFATREARDITIHVMDPTGNDYGSVRVEIDDVAGNRVFEGTTGLNGQISASIIVPSDDPTVMISAPAIGIINPERTVFLDQPATLVVIQ